MDIKNKKGITLVEVIVSVAILAIIMVPISLVFTIAYSSFIRESDKVTAQQSAREVLYGKGMNSYGIMGDLERSNATSVLIKIGDEAADVSAIGPSISITEVTDSGYGQTKKYYYEPATAASIGELKYKIIGSDGLTVSDNNYFENDESSNGRVVEVNGFVAKKVKKGTVIDTTTGAITDTDLIKITVTVACGRSGDIVLQSSYRIPKYER